ncbi:MAG: hypothetical protein HGB12_12980 [Bacteroidetes bacterium]|nr:hypothetical protein [Bacteroidota bacterium]
MKQDKEIRKNIDTVISLPKDINGLFVRYRGQRSWGKGLLGQSIILFLISILLIGVNSGDPDGNVFKAGIIILAVSLACFFVSIFIINKGRKGRKYYGIFSDGVNINTGNLQVVDHDNVVINAKPISNKELQVITTKINEINIRVTFISAGNYLIKDIYIINSVDKTNICKLSYDPCRKLREQECIRIFHRGVIIKTDTFYKEDIINFIEPLEEVSNVLFPCSTIKFSLDIIVNKSNYTANTFLFGLIGIIFSSIADSVQHKTAVRDFLNGEITFKNGIKFGDYCNEHNWDVNIVS